MQVTENGKRPLPSNTNAAQPPAQAASTRRRRSQTSNTQRTKQAAARALQQSQPQRAFPTASAQFRPQAVALSRTPKPHLPQFRRLSHGNSGRGPGR